MLINTADDRVFQAYLDKMEQRLHTKMVPILSAGARIQMSRGGIPAEYYINTRGEPVLLKHYETIYSDAYYSLTPDRIETKAARQSQTQFMQDQQSYLEREAAKKIAGIAQTMVDDIRTIVQTQVQNGKAHDKIAAELIAQIPQISRGRAATIARTETHNAAMAAIDEGLKYKKMTVRTKTWWTVGDAKVRDSHRAVHGMTVSYDTPFDVGGSEMMRPGDDLRGAGADEIVNCRCSILFNLSGKVASNEYAVGDIAAVNYHGDTITVTKAPRAKKEHLVMFDTAKFDARFAKTDSYVGHGGAGGIGNRYAGVKDYLSKNGAMYASEVHVRENGSVIFDNGRHRYAVLRDAGVKEMPMSITEEGLQNAVKAGLLIPKRKQR